MCKNRIQFPIFLGVSALVFYLTRDLTKLLPDSYCVALGLGMAALFTGIYSTLRSRPAPVRTVTRAVQPGPVSIAAFAPQGVAVVVHKVRGGGGQLEIPLSSGSTRS